MEQVLEVVVVELIRRHQIQRRKGRVFPRDVGGTAASARAGEARIYVAGVAVHSGAERHASSLSNGMRT